MFKSMIIGHRDQQYKEKSYLFIFAVYIQL